MDPDLKRSTKAKMTFQKKKNCIFFSAGGGLLTVLEGPLLMSTKKYTALKKTEVELFRF